MITDLNGRNAEILKKKKLWLLDMDGTIYNENEIFEGTLDFLQQIRDNGGRYIFITNNSIQIRNGLCAEGNGHGHSGGLRRFLHLQPGYRHVYQGKLSRSDGILHGNPVFGNGASGKRAFCGYRAG